MDQLEIEAIQNIMIWADLNQANGTFKRKIYVPFQPDIMIVRAISYYPKPSDDFNIQGPFMVFCDLVNDYIGVLPISYDYTNSNALSITPYAPCQRWVLRKEINSDITFRIENQANTPAPYNDGVDLTANVVTGLEGNLNISLEFVRYKSTKPQKVL